MEVRNKLFELYDDLTPVDLPQLVESCHRR